MNKFFIVSILCLTALPVAEAEEQNSSYLAVSASKLTSASTSIGGAIALGRHFSEYLAAEIAYEDSGALSASAERTTAASVALLGFMPVVDSLKAYGRLGYASAHTLDTGGITANHGDITYGVGFEYRASEIISLDLGWNHLRVGDNVSIPRSNENSYVMQVVFDF